MRTWLRFNAVGIAGFGVQLGVLELLLRGCGLGYQAASTLAVEAAILHNYFWHRRWTWAIRPSGRSTLWRFQFTQGLWSLLGTAAFMHMLVGRLGVGPALSNTIATGLCGLVSIVNFLILDRYVFSRRIAF